MSKKATKKTANRDIQNANIKPHEFKKGQSGNPKGKPIGTKSYKTLYAEALIKIAESKGMTAEELEVMLHQSGLAQAFKDYRFYKDTLDRLHGKPDQNTDITSGGEKIEGITVTFEKPK